MSAPTKSQLYYTLRLDDSIIHASNNQTISKFWTEEIARDIPNYRDRLRLTCYCDTTPGVG